MKPLFLDLPVPITTPRLILRPPQVGDGAIINEAVLESLNELVRFSPWAAEKQTLEFSEEFARLAAANWILKKNEEPWLPLLIFDKQTGQFIGGTGFHTIEWEVPRLEIGYWIRTSRSGEGLMTEAVNAQTQYAIKQLNMRRIEIRCDIINLRSKKIPERLGYHLESVMKASRVEPVTGKISDTLVYVKHDLIGLPELEVTWPGK